MSEAFGYKVKGCASAQQTFGLSTGVQVHTNRDVKLVSGLWAGRNVRRCSI